MKSIKFNIFFLVVIILSQVFGCIDSDKYSLEPLRGNSIIFVGNAFAERLQDFNYFEPFLYESFPDKYLTVRNLGWSGDEIQHKSRPINFPSQDSLLYEHKADIIIACYGLNESYSGIDSLMSFKIELYDYLYHIKNQKYDMTTFPEVILVSHLSDDHHEYIVIELNTR